MKKFNAFGTKTCYVSLENHKQVREDKKVVGQEDKRKVEENGEEIRGLSGRNKEIKDL